MYKRLLMTTLPTIALLSACGGGSDSGGSSAPIDTQFSVQTVYQDSCDNEAPNLNTQIAFHRADGSLLSVLTPDSDGTIETTWPDGAKHVSLIHFKDSDELSITTWLDWRSGPLRKQIYNQSPELSCTVPSIIVETSALQAQYPAHTFYLDNVRVDEEAKVIKLAPGQKRLAVHAEHGSGDIAYAAWVEVPDNLEVPMDLPVDLFDGFEHQGEPLQVTGHPYGELGSSFAKTDEGRKFRIFSFNGTDAYYFPKILENNFYKVSLTDEITEGVYYSQTSQKRISNDGSVTLTLPSNKEQYISTVLQTLTALADGTMPLNYDLSHVANSASILNAYIYNDKVSWRINAPLSGQIPELTLPSEAQTRFNSQEATGLYISTSGYGERQEIHSYRKRTEKEIEDSAPFKDTFFIQSVTIKTP